VNLRQEYSEREEVEALGFRSVEIPLRADLVGSRAPTTDQIQTFLREVTDPANAPVFIHCLRGRDRTGTMVAIYRIEVDGWTNEEALEEMDRYGFHGFYKQLRNCVRDYRAPRATGPETGPAGDNPPVPSASAGGG
jgi:protein tyrosine phosphatase (PTP) superfamily phosphohydrolase (DUF442 family)